MPRQSLSEDVTGETKFWAASSSTFFNDLYPAGNRPGLVQSISNCGLGHVASQIIARLFEGVRLVLKELNGIIPSFGLVFLKSPLNRAEGRQLIKAQQGALELEQRDDRTMHEIESSIFRISIV